MPDFMKSLRSRAGFAAKALEFCILTATRTGEVLNARWDQMDMQDGIWTIPASATKVGKEHRVPLSPRAVELLEDMQRARIGDFVFPASATKGLSNMAMSQILKRMGLKVTVHGFRSSFKDWAGEVSNTPNEISEMALAHTIANKAEAAYRRGDLFEKRRQLMNAWTNWCAPKAGNVIKLRGEVRA
jgi:integrase